jgi:hypothetical protein
MSSPSQVPWWSRSGAVKLRGRAGQHVGLGPDQPPGQVVPADLHVADRAAVAVQQLHHRLAVGPDRAEHDRGRQVVAAQGGRDVVTEQGPLGRAGGGHHQAAAAQPPLHGPAGQAQPDGGLGQPGPLGHAVAVLADGGGRGPPGGQRHQHPGAVKRRQHPPALGRRPGHGLLPDQHLDRRGRPPQHLGQPRQLRRPPGGRGAQLGPAHGQLAPAHARAAASSAARPAGGSLPGSWSDKRFRSMPGSRTRS